MYCKSCGKENNQEARFCKNCGDVLESQEVVSLQKNHEQGSNTQGGNVKPQWDNNQVNIKNNLVLAIIVTMLCCKISGIVSIFYAAQVDSLVTNKNYDKARRYSKNAQTWAIVSLVGGILVVIAYIIYVVIIIMLGANDYTYMR